MTEEGKRSSRRGSGKKVPDNLDEAIKGAVLSNVQAKPAQPSAEGFFKTFNLRLDPETHSKLKWLGDHRPESMHDIATRAVQNEIERIYEDTKKMIELYEKTM